MQIVYASHLALPAEPGGSALDSAASAVASWVRHRFGVTVQPLSGGSAESDRARVEWSSMVGASGGLVGVVVDQGDTNDRDWRWRTYVDLGVEDGQAWVRVRVGLYSPIEGLLTSPKVITGRPGVVRALADQLSIRTDGWHLDEWRPVLAEDVERYLAFLKEPDRRLPVVALSEDQAGETFLDPAHIADRLLGLAHIVTVDGAAAYRVSDRVGKTLSCFLGAVRIYWPRFTERDDPYHHRLFVGGTLTYLGREGLEAELFNILGRLAGLSLDEPLLRRRLKIEQRTAEIEARVAERAETSERLAESAKSKDGAVPAEEFAEFAAEFDEMHKHVSELELASVEAEIELERLRKERDDARRQLVEVVRDMGQEKPLEITDEPVVEPPSTVRDAVDRAAAIAKCTVYLQSAFDSADASQYEDPSRVLDDLVLIDQVAQDWVAGELEAGPHTTFKQRCSGYRDGIGQKATTQYKADYEREYNGQQIVLGPHIRRGIGPVASIMRIYMFFDVDSKRIVVGHVGKKLRDASNRN